jgi:hypothetical protein
MANLPVWSFYFGGAFPPGWDDNPRLRPLGDADYGRLRWEDDGLLFAPSAYGSLDWTASRPVRVIRSRWFGVYRAYR